MVELATFECPTCRGQTIIGGVACGPRGCDVAALPCPTCGGDGVITEQHRRWIAYGGVMREARRRVSVSIRQAAAAFGVEPRELAAAERGDVDPMPLFDRHVDVYRRLP